MKKISILLISAALYACMPVQNYKLSSELTQQDRDEAACRFAASEAKSDMYPKNLILNAQARSSAFDLCMKSKGYIPSNE